MSIKTGKSEKQIKEEQEKERREVQKELFKLDNQIMQERREKQKKIIKWSIIIILFFIIFKCTIGYFVFPFAFQYKKNREYVVELNGNQVVVDVIETKVGYVIPFLVKYGAFGGISFVQPSDGPDGHITKVKKGEKVHLEIKSYKCFREVPNMRNIEYQRPCDMDHANSNDQKFIRKPVNDTKYKINIKKGVRMQTEIYDGAFINDVSNYLSETGTYMFYIYGKYKNVKVDLYFQIKVID